LSFSSLTAFAKINLKCILQKKIVTSERFFGTYQEEIIILAAGEIREGFYSFDKSQLPKISWTFEHYNDLLKENSRMVKSYNRTIHLLSQLEPSAINRVEYKIKNNGKTGSQIVLSSFNPKLCGSLREDCNKTYLINTDRFGSIEAEIAKEGFSSMYSTPWWINGEPLQSVDIDLSMLIKCEHIIKI